MAKKNVNLQAGGTDLPASAGQAGEPLEKQLWKSADKLRKNIDAAEYKHVVLGLIFLKYISDAFEELYNKLNSKEGDYEFADPEDKEEYKAENVFFVPPTARWSFLKNHAKQPTIGKTVDESMDAIERENQSLKGVLPKVYARQNLDPTSLGELIDLITALSKSFAIAIPHEEAMDVKDEVSFFQAVKARLAKFSDTGTGKTDEEIDLSACDAQAETTIRQVIDKALVSEKVIDIFDAAGIKKPDISILSEDFLLELKGMEHKNVALEVLKKLLNDEIKSRSKKNLVKSRSLMEMLENSIKKYHNKILTVAEVMDELIKLSKEIVNMDSEDKALNLTDFEYAFYTAVADNKSDRELMQKDKLRELAIILTERVKANASIDWTIKESVRAKLKVIIKRTLRQYGYPPDMQKLATETVLKQAELIANELTNG